MVNQLDQHKVKERDSKLIRIDKLIYSRLKERAKKERLTMRLLADAYLSEGLKVYMDTIRYFQEKYEESQKRLFS